jgi:excisionase family DNA binding protein
MTTREAATKLGVSVRRIQAMIKQGLIVARKMGRDWFIEASAVEKLGSMTRPAGRPRKRPK